MKNATSLVLLLALTATCFLVGCDDKPATKPTKPSAPKPEVKTDTEMTLYCGREESLVGSIIEAFEKETGIDVKVKYGSTAQLASLIETEGDQSPADVFWAQDVAALGQVSAAGRFTPLPQDIRDRVAPTLQNAEGLWIGTSGRARVLAYAPSRVKTEDLPQSIFDLTNEKWKGKVGWAPRNGSFQAFLTAMRKKFGDDKAKAWVIGMKENGAKVYPKNTPIIQALADGEIDLGIPNHYYLLRFKKEQGADFPVEQTFFKAGDIGNMVLVAGVGKLKTAKHGSAADKFIAYLLTQQSAKAYVDDNHYEFPTAKGVKANPNLPGEDKLGELAPEIELDKLGDLEGTKKLLTEAGVL